MLNKNEIVRYFETLPPEMLNQQNWVYKPGESCCVGAHLAHILTQDQEFTQGADAWAHLIGGNRAHAILILRQAGAPHDPFSEEIWNVPPARVFEAAAKVETLPGLRGADLSHTVLSNADLQGADLREANLQHAMMDNVYLQGADLSGANLQSAYLGESRLDGATLTGADLEGVVLPDAQMTGVNLDGANLRGAHLQMANLKNSSLKQANLKGADLWKANLEEANLTGANLEGANIFDVNLRNADTTDINMTDVRFEE